MANKFVPWIDEVEPGTTTQEQSVFAEDSQRVNGFVAGDPASAIRVNSALRQANVVVAALMQLADELKTLPDLDLNSKVADIASALKASIITPIETHLTEIDDEIAALEGGSSTLTDRVDTLESEMDAVQSKNTQQDSQIGGLTSRMSTAESDISAIETKNTQQDSSISSLNSRMGTAEGDISAIKTKNTQQDSSISSLGTRLTNAENDIDTLQSDMTQAKSDIDAVEAKNTTQDGQISQLQTDIENAESRLDKLENFYEADVAMSNWSGSAGNYTYSIAATTHNRGTRPRVHTYVDGDETYDSPTIDWSTGNVTLHSNAQVAMKVLIY